MMLHQNVFGVFIRKIREKALGIEAKMVLPERVQYLASVHSFTYTHVSVSSARTRWGSCSMVIDCRFRVIL